MDLRFDKEACCSKTVERASGTLLQQLDRLAIELLPEAFFGCGLENGCTLHGCAALRKAVDLLRQ